MISDLDSLVFSLHHNRGVYALLLGSGVSKAAQIPTGWEVIQDLVRKLATSQGEESPADPAKWYRDKAGKEPDYSDLLEKLAPSPPARQALLRPYFEPTDKEREEGIKLPTKAHEAIARLVRDGVIRVILTTNFDRLLEQALGAEGVHPTVVSTPDDIEGAPPLAQLEEPLVVKLHGDYQDSRIRNTASELEKYDPRQDEFLDRVIDEFGLIIAGWSGDWDEALRSAIARAESRRYVTYWAAYRGQLTKSAEKLIQLRQGRILEIEDADAFFEAVAERVEALKDFDRPHPISKEIAVARLKKYLPEDRHRIRLHDLLYEETERAYERLFEPGFSLSTQPNVDAFGSRVENYEAAIESLEALLAVGGYWGRLDQAAEWIKVLTRIGNVPDPRSGSVVWLNLLRYPAARLCYAIGLGALAGKKYDVLWQVFASQRIRLRGQGSQPIVMVSDPRYLDRHRLNKLGHTSRSEWFQRGLRPSLRFAVPDDEEWSRLFDRYEFLQALAMANLSRGGEPPYIGRFGHVNRVGVGPITEFFAEINGAGRDWLPLQQGFVNGSFTDLQEALETIKSYMGSY